jgi:TonB family protein
VRTGFVSFALLFASFSFPTQAQEATLPEAANNPQIVQGPGPLPHDPASAVKFAANVNGLSGPDVKPWHLKASYQVLGREGNLVSSGTYEESWVSETKYKRSYRSDRFTQTDFSTEHGLFRSGDQDWPPGPEQALRLGIIDPAWSPDPKHIKPQMKERSSGPVHLDCLVLNPKDSGPSPSQVPQECFDKNSSRLLFRTAGSGMRGVIYNDITLFHGRWVARSLREEINGKPQLIAKVETIENLSRNDADFTPTADAKGPIPPSALRNGESFVELDHRVPPEYPSIARQARIQGVVILRAVIARDGHIKSLDLESGRPELQKAAIDAVRKWTYHPFPVGAPAEVENEIQVAFVLGGG